MKGCLILFSTQRNKWDMILFSGKKYLVKINDLDFNHVFEKAHIIAL